MCSWLTFSSNSEINLTCPLITKVMRSTVYCKGLQSQNAMLIWIIIFGGLHINLTVLKIAETLLESSGWTGALVQAGVATSGKADSFLKASHITPTRRAH